MWKLTNATYLLAILIAMMMVFNIPSAGLAQSNQASTPQPPQPKGGIAKVIGVDQPDNCLRIRSGPGNHYDVIGCANMGDELKITGVWTSNDWAQLVDNGWVHGPQISTDLRPQRTAYSRPPAYVVREEVVPDYDDWAYLPDYGYDTYWYGDVPIFFYNVAVWSWWHPWWWWQGLQAWWWQDGFNGQRNWDPNSFRNFATNKGVNFATAERANVSALNSMGRSTKSASIASSSLSKLNVNRSNITSPNVSRFNANRPNIGSSNVNRFNANRFNGNRSNITSPNVNRFNTNKSNANRSNIRSSNQNRLNTNRFRSGSTNALHSRSFSSPTRTFSTPQTSRSFSSPHTSSMGNSVVRSFNASPGRGFSGAAGVGDGHHR